MSRRYGRNQKRRAREEITALRQRCQVTEHFADRWEQSAKVERGESARATGMLRQVIDMIERVCPNSIILPPKQIKGIHEHEELTLQQRSVKMRPFLAPGTTADTVTYHTISTHALRLFLESNYETLQKVVHLTYNAGGHSAYMLSEQAFCEMTDLEIIQQIGPVLVDQLRKERGFHL